MNSWAGLNPHSHFRQIKDVSTQQSNELDSFPFLVTSNEGCVNSRIFSNRCDTAKKEAQSCWDNKTAPNCWQAIEHVNKQVKHVNKQVNKRCRLPSEDLTHTRSITAMQKAHPASDKEVERHKRTTASNCTTQATESAEFLSAHYEDLGLHENSGRGTLVPRRECCPLHAHRKRNTAHLLCFSARSPSFAVAEAGIIEPKPLLSI